MLSLDQGSMAQLWSADPYHRYQAVALLKGHFSLANSIDEMQPGLAWHNGHIQQVWGLGVGFWLMPFQALWWLFDGQVFPDRVALGLAFALLGFYAATTGLRMAKGGHRVMGLGLIWLIVLCPPLWSLARFSQSVFDQTVLYANLVSLGILISLVRIAWLDSRKDYWICCGLSALAAWVRPTHGIYGLGAVLLGSLIIIYRHRATKPATVGSLIFVLSLAFLGMTNWTRFGAPLEFGHRLTVSSRTMVFLPRFGNPFREASSWEATKELTGLLFLNPNIRDGYVYAGGLFPGQAPVTRWRRLYLTAFDPSYVFCGLAAAGGTVLWTWRYRRGRLGYLWQEPNRASIVTLFLWSSIAIAGLGLFYLHFPIIASRYLLDFAPALIGLVACTWIVIAHRGGIFLWQVLGGWLLFEIASTKVVPQIPEFAYGTAAQSELPHIQMTSLNKFGGIYSLSHHPADAGLSWNGYGWGQNGFANDVVILAIDSPQFVELNVADREVSRGASIHKDTYRAMIDGMSLPLREVVRDDSVWKVKFDIPMRLHGGRNGEILFLCFSKEYDVEDRDSDRMLYSVRWK